MKIPKDFLKTRQAMHGVAWRSELAKELARSNRRLAGCEDEPLRHYVKYLTMLEISGDEGAAVAAFPDMAAAQAIDSDGPLADQLKIMLLGRLETAEICSRAKIEPAALKIWTALFFDLAGGHKSPGWLVRHIIDPQRAAGRTDFAGKLGLALQGGPDGARLALDLDTGLPLAKADQLEREELRLALKKEEALRMPLKNSDDAYRWYKLHLDDERANKRLALDKQKFEVRCAQLQRREESRRQQAAQKPPSRAQQDQLRREQFAQVQEQIAARAASSPLAHLRWEKANANVPVVEAPAVLPFSRRAENPEPLAASRGGALGPEQGEETFAPSLLPSATSATANHAQEPARHSA